MSGVASVDDTAWIKKLLAICCGVSDTWKMKGKVERTSLRKFKFQRKCEVVLGLGKIENGLNMSED